ncbi:MAG TPA: exodeoxyribonuclease VII large subunit [Candidatus Blautia merdigallinarum]|uniref:Exodeoxyribonuclease 7 large subunit n=1 Tax=Candidatus Blautia merdigallinarum TaxID=2838495 RepID=A0A9D2SK45_9FIRM|nr:exodeoxyribonuclease VII large subunit [Candidatus Blautia merdigallinarum]
MNSIYSVGQVNTYIKNMFNQDFMLNRIYIKGEVSNCKYHTSGHIYFSLKDETGTISCVMFAGQRKGLAFPMKNGDRVVAGGSVSVYERDGKYQLYAKEITLEGAGLLYERFLALKKELEEMGMFAQEYKQPIPKYARKVGVVTAPTGAAIQDIRNIAGRRNPYVQLILYPALVQGEGAVQSIVKGIQTLDRLGVDVIIVGRGGGSIEDLWAFNEEAVARAIFDCRTPVISAVGHETDTTIADYVSDLRAPTPSGAAELAVADIRTLFDTLENYRKKMDRAMENRLLLLRQDLKNYQLRLRHGSPGYRIQEMRTHLMDCEGKLDSAMRNQIYLARQRLNIYIERMKGLSPLDKLNQGFSFVEDSQGHGVNSISQAQIGDRLMIRVTDGTFETEVKRKKREERNTGDGPDRKQQTGNHH